MINIKDKVLYGIIAMLVLVILLGTILGVTVGKHKPGENLRDADPTPKQAINLNKKNPDKIAAFTELGTIRAVTKPYPTADKPDDSGTAVVITPWLSYPEGDTVFFEELSRKRLVIKGIFTNYFATHTQKELLSRSEESVKAELLDQINEQLTLGKVSAVYFSDYIYLQ